MKNIFFRTTSLWASVLYMALGLVLTFWPGMSGTVFCWGIAAALILYAAHSFWYFIKARNLGFTAGGTLGIGILCLAFGIFCFSRPYVVLSFLPIALGIMLLVDGIGKMPLAVDALSVYSPYRFWVLIRRTAAHSRHRAARKSVPCRKSRHHVLRHQHFSRRSL